MQLADRHGRVATDLRVSLTDRCNLRCQYCMPAEGLDWAPTEQVLTDAEVIRLIEVAVTRLGVTSVRFTGGEPLLRKGLPEIVAAANALGARTALTTNGLGLQFLAGPLKDAGLGPRQRQPGFHRSRHVRRDHPARSAGRRDRRALRPRLPSASVR